MKSSCTYTLSILTRSSDSSQSPHKKLKTLRIFSPKSSVNLWFPYIDFVYAASMEIINASSIVSLSVIYSVSPGTDTTQQHQQQHSYKTSFPLIIITYIITTLHCFCMIYYPSDLITMCNMFYSILCFLFFSNTPFNIKWKPPTTNLP